MEDFIRFTNNSAGFEKILKGSQGLCKILTAESSGRYPSLLATTKPIRKGFGTAQEQISLGRRFVRFLWFIDSAIKALGAQRGHGDKILKALILGKWVFTTVYTFSEAVTVLHAMGIRKTRWAKPFVQLGLKCYFISICCSILASLYQLIPYMLNPDLLEQQQQQQQRLAYAHASSSTASSSGAMSARIAEDRRRSSATSTMSRPPPPYDTESSTRQEEYEYSQNGDIREPSSHRSRLRGGIDPDMERKKLYVDAAKNAPASQAPVKVESIILQLFGDVCDIWGPASGVGWMKVSSEALGFASVVNALLGGKVIWDRVNAG